MLISQNQNWLIYCHNCKGQQVQNRLNSNFDRRKPIFFLLFASCCLCAFASLCSRIQVSIPIFNLVPISVRPPSEVGQRIKITVMFYWLKLVFKIMSRSEMMIDCDKTLKPWLSALCWDLHKCFNLFFCRKIFHFIGKTARITTSIILIRRGSCQGYSN